MFLEGTQQPVQSIILLYIYNIYIIYIIYYNPIIIILRLFYNLLFTMFSSTSKSTYSHQSL